LYALYFQSNLTVNSWIQNAHFLNCCITLSANVKTLTTVIIRFHSVPCLYFDFNYCIVSASIVDEAHKMQLKVPIYQVQKSDNSQGPLELKRSRYYTVSVFPTYEGSPATPLNAAVTTIETLVTSYISYISDSRCTWAVVPEFEYYTNILPLLEFTFCAPATSAPVERIFSQGGLFIRPHRARLEDKLLCQLMLSKCNKHL